MELEFRFRGNDRISRFPIEAKRQALWRIGRKSRITAQ